MSELGRIVVLNGTPRSGKSSLARAIQDTLPGEWMNLGVDVFRAATPNELQPGIGLRPGGERPDLEPFLPTLYLAMYEAVVARARQGLHVAVDVGHHDWYSKPLGILRLVAPLLADVEALFVGVRCPVEVVMERRDATGWTREPPFADGSEVPEAVLRWQRAVHDPGVYDFEVDTAALTPEQGAAKVRRRLEDGPPTAFRRLADHGNAGAPAAPRR